jgi:hypothetical protein
MRNTNFVDNDILLIYLVSQNWKVVTSKMKWAWLEGKYYSKLDIFHCSVKCGKYGSETWSLTLREEPQTEGVWEQGDEENIWSEERWSDGWLEKTA